VVLKIKFLKEKNYLGKTYYGADPVIGTLYYRVYSLIGTGKLLPVFHSAVRWRTNLCLLIGTLTYRDTESFLVGKSSSKVTATLCWSVPHSTLIPIGYPKGFAFGDIGFPTDASLIPPFEYGVMSILQVYFGFSIDRQPNAI